MTHPNSHSILPDLLFGVAVAADVLALAMHRSDLTHALGLDRDVQTFTSAVGFGFEPDPLNDDVPYPLAHVIGAELDDGWLPADEVELYDPNGEGDCWLSSTKADDLTDVR